MVTAVSSAATATSTAASSGQSPGVINSDFQTFLVMLTTQMQNQDPLNPIESTEYATQLAQFSQVEQAVKTNDLLAGLGTQLSAIGMSQLAGWVGLEARTTEPVAFDGSTPIDLEPEVPTGADRAVLVIRDAEGAIVHSTDIPVDTESYSWAGLVKDGAMAPKGLYSFEVQGYQNGASLPVREIAVYSEIVEAQIGANGTMLTLKGGSTISSDDVSALRKPD